MSWRRVLMATLSETDVSVIGDNLQRVLDRIRIVYDSTPSERRSSQPVRLVAASKTKPVPAVLAAYRLGQRHFGENYVQELIAKANDPKIISECADIRWHFIGHLQSNKIPKLIQSVPNLFLLETVDSDKCARKLDAAFKEKLEGAVGQGEKFLRVMVEVNTSGETQKSGLSPEDAVDLAATITNSCSALRFLGFMTIGSFEHSGDDNPDFLRLLETRRTFCRKHSIDDEKTVELSMGMSADFETAIKMGATNVRIGSTIFGARAIKTPE